MKRGLGDIVTMPLPTEWGPEAYSGAAVARLPGGGGVLVGGSLAPGYGPTGAPQGFTVGPGGLRIPAPVAGPPGTFPRAQQGVWQREPWLPDAVLPPELQRSNPSVGNPTFYPNRYDGEIARQSELWRWIAQHGGLKSCCRVPELGAPVYDVDPRQSMPAGAQEFKRMYALPPTSFQTAGVYDGVDRTLGQFRVDVGYDGVINRFVCGFSGDGFTDFSGFVVWRVRVNQRYAKDLGNVLNSFGSFQNALLVPGNYLPLVSGQTVTLLANIPVGSPAANGMVSAGVFGWFYPHR